jgi:hypothetical protein
MHVNSVSGVQECAPWRVWPSALNEEIQAPDAPEQHDRMCGAWIEAGNSLSIQTPSYWAFYDGEAQRAAVENAERATYASARLSGTDLGKFYTACSHTVLGGNGALRAAAVPAYRYLREGIGAPSTQDEALAALGWLASHYCDGPLQLGVALGYQYYAWAQPGSVFERGDLARALFSVDEGPELQGLAEEASALVNQHAYASPETGLTAFERILEGATGRTDHEDVPLARLITPELDGFLWLTNHSSTKLVRAYLDGLAARCAFSIRATMDGSIGSVLEGLRSTRPAAAALGRLQQRPDAEPLAEVTEEAELDASTTTWTQIRGKPSGDPAADCAAFARFVFPDRVDEQHFALTVSDKLYARMEQVTGWLRAAVADTVLAVPAFRDALADPDAVAAAVNRTVIRIPGAPRGSWAGVQRPLVDGGLEASDGVMLMALKHARGAFLDRMSALVFDDANHCSGPPIYDALVQNAYIYVNAGCSYVLLGILRKPLADERYDNASLAARAGWVVAHELAHNTLATGWNAGAAQALLGRYPANVHSEAMADVLAAVAAIRAGLATPAQMCAHASQVWCARTPVGYVGSTGSHPGANQRGDWLCETLVAVFGYEV